MIAYDEIHKVYMKLDFLVIVIRKRMSVYKSVLNYDSVTVTNQCPQTLQDR